eukprot:TRINITY_DN909_c0_g1_i1.p1 TRINITY_DN909_c0_g1~~TRINITY_DN909_c0_g1_i1.p1  ORF type:complete len:1369 (+),score=139.37 TRINITY_DN909_c0_g1_i1:110-4108(+)
MQEQAQHAYIKRFLDDLDRFRRANWLPDNAASTCFKCHTPFTFSQRRHHCRVCGNVFCTKCSSKKSIAGHKTVKSVRVCDKCYKLLNSFTKDLDHSEKQRLYHTKVKKDERLKGEGVPEEIKTERTLNEIEQEHILRICKKLCEENKIPEEYEARLSEMVLHAVSTVKPSVTIKDGMKFTDYVKIKLMPGKDISASRYVNGVVFTKNVADKRMRTDLINPSILLIRGDLAGSKEDIEIDSFRDILALETHFAQKITKIIMGIKPSVIIVEKSVSIPILEKLRDQNITVFCNVKQGIMNRIARLTGTAPCLTADLLSRHLPLGKCVRCFIESVQRTGKESIARIDRSYTFFEGCIESLGCTLCIAGKDIKLLQRVKTVLRQMLFFGRDLALETAYLIGLNVDWTKANGKVYLMDAIGIDRYISANEILITKLYLHQAEVQYNAGLSEDLINRKGRRLCGEPKRIKLQCYTNKEDSPFGEFVTDIMEIINEQCSICQRKRFTHQLIYYHGYGKIKVNAEPNNEHVEVGTSNGLYIKGECKKCKKTVAAPRKIGELYEYSLARVMIEYFYNSTLVNQSESCNHLVVSDIVRKIYNKEVVITMEYEEKEVYTYVTGGTVFDTLEKSASVFDQLSSLEKSKKLINECSQHVLSQYEKIKVVIHDSVSICPKEHIRPLIKNVLTWLQGFQEDLLKQYDRLISEDNDKEKKKVKLYAARHSCILKQLHLLLQIITKSCEPPKEACKEVHDSYALFLATASECLQNESFLLTPFQSLQPSPAVKPRSSGSVGALNEIILAENDYGTLIADAMRTKEYNEAITEILRVDKKENSYESMESELLGSNNYCIEIEMGGKESKPTNITVFKNHERHEFLLDPEHPKDTFTALPDNEKVLEKHLTEIITFRMTIEKALEAPEVALLPLTVTEEVVSEVNGLLKQVKQEQQSAANNDRVAVYIYCANQFEALRSCLGLSEKDYINSLGKTFPWKDVSGGKANANFCKTKDGRMILKFIKKKERDLFERCAPQYFKHMCKAIAHKMPSILVRNLGMYKVKVGHSVACEIVVMENLCYGISPTVVYDLKGSVKRRYVKKEERIGGRVLLDTNFKEDHKGEPLVLDEESGRHLQESIHNDTLLLSKLNVMDYSLLAVIDQKNRAMKAGILDIFREFNSAELLEYHTKRAINLGEKPTVIAPNSYKKRFRAAMKKYFVQTGTICNPQYCFNCTFTRFSRSIHKMLIKFDAQVNVSNIIVPAQLTLFVFAFSYPGSAAKVVGIAQFPGPGLGLAFSLVRLLLPNPYLGPSLSFSGGLYAPGPGTGNFSFLSIVPRFPYPIPTAGAFPTNVS